MRIPGANSENCDAVEAGLQDTTGVHRDNINAQCPGPDGRRLLQESLVAVVFTVPSSEVESLVSFINDPEFVIIASTNINARDEALSVTSASVLGVTEIATEVPSLPIESSYLMDTTGAPAVEDDDSDDLNTDGIIGMVILGCVVAILILIVYVACKISKGEEGKTSKDQKAIMELTQVQTSLGRNVSNDTMTLKKLWSEDVEENVSRMIQGGSAQLQTPKGAQKIQIQNIQNESSTF